MVYVYICLHMWFMYICKINMVNILVNGTTMVNIYNIYMVVISGKYMVCIYIYIVDMYNHG